VQSERYGYGCCVESTIYKAAASPNYDIVNNSNEIELGLAPFVSFGKKIIPAPITPGQSYKVKISGRMDTSGSDEAIVFRIYLGNTLVGSTVASNDALRKNLSDSCWTLDAEIVPVATRFDVGATFIRCDGMFIFNNIVVNGEKNIGGIGIQSSSYSLVLGVGTSVNTNDDHELRVTAQFLNASLSNSIIVDNHQISQSAFNQ
jgi:hypothetical protein